MAPREGCAAPALAVAFQAYTATLQGLLVTPRTELQCDGVGRAEDGALKTSKAVAE